MKDLTEALFVFRNQSFGITGEVASPKMLRKLGIHLKIFKGHFIVLGSFKKLPISLRGKLNGDVVETSSIVSFTGNIVKTSSGSKYRVRSLNRDYVSLYLAEKKEIPILFDWVLGTGSDNLCHIAAKVFDGEKISTVEDRVDFISIPGIADEEQRNYIAVDSQPYFIIWANPNFYAEKKNC